MRRRYCDLDVVKADTFNRLLLENLHTESPHDPTRNYLGMSQIGDCALELYRKMVGTGGAARDDVRMRWYEWTGQIHEEAVLKLLGVKQTRHSIVAAWDSRFRGHTDHEINDTVVDIKSTHWKKFLEIKGNNHLVPHMHQWQMQAYMKYGPYEHGVLIYIARDVPHEEWAFPFVAVDVSKNDAVGEKLEQKAAMILYAIDKRSELEIVCNCWKCGGKGQVK